MKKIAFVTRYLLFIIIISACQANNNDNLASPTASIQKSTFTPTTKPTTIPTTTVLPTSTSTSTPTITPTPLWPVGLSTNVPENLPTISANNIGHLVEVAQWGDGKIYQMGFSPDGSKLWVVTTTGMRIYDSQTLELLTIIKTSIADQQVTAWAISPNFKYFAVHNHNYKIILFDLSNGKAWFSTQMDSDCKGSLFFSPKDNYLAKTGVCSSSKSTKNTIIVFDVNKREVVYSVKEVGYGIFTSEENLITYQNNTISLLNAPNFDLAFEYTNPDPIKCLNSYLVGYYYPWSTSRERLNCGALSPDNSTFSLSFRDWLILFEYSASSSSLNLSKRHFSGRPTFSPSSNLLSVQYSSYSSRFIDLETDEQLLIPSNFKSFVFSQDESRVAGFLYITDPKTTFIGVKLINVLEGGSLGLFNDYNRFSFSSNGDYLSIFKSLSSTYLPPIIVNAKDGSILLTLEGQSSPNFSPNNEYLTTTSSSGVTLYKIDTGKVIATVKGYWPQFHPDGESFYSFEPNMIYKWSAKDGSLLDNAQFLTSPIAFTMNLNNNNFYEINSFGVREINHSNLNSTKAFPPDSILSPSGNLYVVNETGNVNVFLSDTMKLLYSIPTNATLIQFSPDGNFIATIDSFGDVLVVDSNTGSITNQFDIGVGYFRSFKIEFKPDNSMIFVSAAAATGYGQKRLLSWWLDTGYIFIEKTDICSTSFALSNDNTYLAYIDSDCKTNLYHLEKWSITQTIDDAGTLLFSANNEVLAIAQNYKGIKFYDTASGELIKILVENGAAYEIFQRVNKQGGYTALPQWGTSINFSENGQFFIRTANGIATFWGLKP